MDVSDRLDLRAAINRSNRSTLGLGLGCLIGVPLIGLVVIVIMILKTGNIYFWVPIVMGLSALIGIAFIYDAVTNMRNPAKHPAVKWSELGTPAQIIASIEDEWNNCPPSHKYRLREYYLIPSWLLQIDGLSTLTYPLRYVAWSYLSIKSNYVNGVPTGKTYKIQICRTDGFSNAVSVNSEEEAMDFLSTLQEFAPWAFYGHVPELQRAWSREKEALFAAVRERYNLVNSGGMVAKSESPMAADTSDTPAESAPIAVPGVTPPPQDKPISRPPDL